MASANVIIRPILRGLDTPRDLVVKPAFIAKSSGAQPFSDVYQPTSLDLSLYRTELCDACETILFLWENYLDQSDENELRSI